MSTISRYRYGNSPNLLPVTWDEPCPDGETIRAAGFVPTDSELSIGRLTEDWNGHPEGALVISGLLLEGHRFSVVEDDTAAQYDTPDLAENDTPDDMPADTATRPQTERTRRLREAMARRGLTRRQVVELTGASRRTVDNWLLPGDSRSHREPPESALRLVEGGT